jgi:tetratricopeptide (TPR) repeat protein
MTLRIRSMRWCVMVAVLGLASVAQAGDPLAKPVNVEARDRLTAGNRLYRVQEFEKAAAEYKAGALKEDASVFLYNLGQCYRQLGRYKEAIWHYKQFLDRAKPEGELKDAIDGFIKEMSAELERKAMTQPPVGPAPDVNEPPPPESPPTVLTMIDRGEPWYRDGLAWGLTGVGAIAAGLSIGLAVNAKGLDDDANAEPQQNERDALHSRASNRRLIGTVAGVTGGVLLVTGIIKLAIRPTDRKRTITTSMRLGVRSDGIVVMGRF